MPEIPDAGPLAGVIICADDFAVNASASLGIARLAQLGRINATSAMVLSSRWAQDAALLHGVRGRIDVGLHLDWTSDFAQAAGHGMPLGTAMRRAMLGGFEKVHASAVIERQLDAFETQWGSAPDFVDGHQHVQQFAGIREALATVLARRYASTPVKPYLRVSRPPRGSAGLKGYIIGWMGANALEKLAVSADLKWARGLFGIYDFSGDGARYARLMQRWLAQIVPGSILMCHPAQAAEPGDEIGVARLQEFAYLAGPAFAQTLQAARVQPMRGCQVLDPRMMALRDAERRAP